MKLTNVQIHKYKSVETDQSFKVEDGITVLVGMNEAGKTSILEAIAKINYFTQDEGFKFSTTHDYPRKEKKKLDKSSDDPKAVTLTFYIDDKLFKVIEEDLGECVFKVKNFSYSKKYSEKGLYSGIIASLDKFIDWQFDNFGIEANDLASQLKKCNNTTVIGYSMATVQPSTDRTFNEQTNTKTYRTDIASNEQARLRF